MNNSNEDLTDLTKEKILDEVLNKNSDKRSEVEEEFKDWAQDELKKINTSVNKNLGERIRRASMTIDHELKDFNRFSKKVLDFFDKNSENINWQHIANDSKSMDEIVENCEYGENFNKIIDETNDSEKTNTCNHNIEEVKSILKLLGILRHNVIDIIIDN